MDGLNQDIAILDDLARVMMINDRIQRRHYGSGAPAQASRETSPISHRKPRRTAVRVALWGALGILGAIVGLSVHAYGSGATANQGYYWHTPATPSGWTFGYETRGPQGPGWFGPDAD